MNFLLYWGAAAQIIFVIAVFGGGSIAGLMLRHDGWFRSTGCRRTTKWRV